jgi:uncharacterized protein YodC (DUF2158 family)
MESKEIQEIQVGDVVCLKFTHFRMVVGDIKDGIAKCFWANANEVGHEDIPVIILTHYKPNAEQKVNRPDLLY